MSCDRSAARSATIEKRLARSPQSRAVYVSRMLTDSDEPRRRLWPILAILGAGLIALALGLLSLRTTPPPASDAFNPAGAGLRTQAEFQRLVLEIRGIVAGQLALRADATRTDRAIITLRMDAKPEELARAFTAIERKYNVKIDDASVIAVMQTADARALLLRMTIEEIAIIAWRCGARPVQSPLAP